MIKNQEKTHQEFILIFMEMTTFSTIPLYILPISFKQR